VFTLMCTDNKREKGQPDHLCVGRSVGHRCGCVCCYDMEVGENRVRVFYGIEKREKEKDSRYIQEASAPAAAPCIRPVTCLRYKYTCNICNLSRSSDEACLRENSNHFFPRRD